MATCYMAMSAVAELL